MVLFLDHHHYPWASEKRERDVRKTSFFSTVPMNEILFFKRIHDKPAEGQSQPNLT